MRKIRFEYPPERSCRTMADPTNPLCPATKMRLFLSMSPPAHDYAMTGIRKCLFLTSQFHVVFDHHTYQISKCGSRSPFQLVASLGSVSPKVVYFGGPQVARVQFHMTVPVDAGKVSGQIQELPNRVRFSGSH